MYWDIKSRRQKFKNLPARGINNGRWLLASNGNGEFYEYKLHDHTFKQILTQLNGNAIVFNYPGVASSSGWPNRFAMMKAYHALLNFLEDQEKGVGAQEIIGYGHSLGGAVQGDALLTHDFKQGIKYVFVKSLTFSNLRVTAALLTNRLLGLLVRVLNWNMGSEESSKKLRVPEIIMQTANVDNYTDISGRPELIIDDGGHLC
jgi:alpha-beta hydrolase superfamily lysophospholipase